VNFEKVKVKSRWKLEHFEELYNDPRIVLSELLKNTEEENEPGIMLDKGRAAIAKMKKTNHQKSITSQRKKFKQLQEMSG